ncbi:MAG TPA: M20/M25/M40 family metallo-hydrolase [Thermoanaerobaculia bacterium]|nr:M20/M25/M40 family metallo-hydrolase [Thermoanaerobaculia bacterium]
MNASLRSAASPAEILQRLIRFDTTNPPGRERPCIAYIAELLAATGVPATWLAVDPERPNLVARFTGEGTAPPLLLYGHVDVVTTAEQVWQHPPFEGLIADGYLWGRGALDMKGGIAMMLAALLRLVADGARPAGDVLLAILSDEEGAGTHGAKHVVEQHAMLLANVRHAIGEFGGFSLTFKGRRFYPVMVAEKQTCCLRTVLRGPGGHGSLPFRGTAMGRLGRVLTAVDSWRLPVHIHPVVAHFITELSGALPPVPRWLLRRLLNPVWTDRVLDLLGENGRLFDPMLRDTVAATVVRGGHKLNVIPSEIELELDGRLLPGHLPEDLLRPLRTLAGPGAEITVTRYDPGPSTFDLSLYADLAAVLRECDGEGIPVPFLLTGTTDARFFHRLGIQTYGFLPMKLPPEFNFIGTIHAADERVPVSALEFGTDALGRFLRRYGRPAA